MPNDICELIRQKLPTFSKSQKRIAEAILSNYEQTAFMTAAKLGQMVGVSESTVVRFATELGFAGYPEFQRAVRDLIRVKLTPVQRISITNARLGNGDLLTNVMNSDVNKIRQSLESIDREAFEKAVSHLLGAKRVFIIGVRSSFALASFLSFNLSMIMDNVHMIQPTSTSEVFEQILDISAGDVIFAISFPRYSIKIVKAVRYAKANKAKIVVLTDSQLSPIAEYADCLLTAESDMGSLVDSLIAPLSIINAILAAITLRRPEEIQARFERLETIWDQYDIYAKR
jgi:DNA-binding MurR/RpiR family transcriptional regulator